MFAIISDIHSNLEALQTVLADIEQRGIKEIICLGDVIGYGPNPKECLDLIESRCRMCLMGNHDHAVLYEPCNFNSAAERAAYWTRQTLEQEPDREKRNQRWKFLCNLPIRAAESDVLYVHASPRRPINEYIFPEDVFTNPQKVMSNFERLEGQLCFVGHTHQPGVFLDDPYFDPPSELSDAPFFEVTDKPAIINVGSVGQPRDRDPRASYVVIHDDQRGRSQTGLLSTIQGCTIEEIEFIRLEYDIQKTVDKILTEPALDDMLGHRLFEGR